MEMVEIEGTDFPQSPGICKKLKCMKKMLGIESGPIAIIISRSLR